MAVRGMSLASCRGIVDMREWLFEYIFVECNNKFVKYPLDLSTTCIHPLYLIIRMHDNNKKN